MTCNGKGMVQTKLIYCLTIGHYWPGLNPTTSMVLIFGEFDMHVISNVIIQWIIHPLARHNLSTFNGIWSTIEGSTSGKRAVHFNLIIYCLASVCQF